MADDVYGYDRAAIEQQRRAIRSELRRNQSGNRSRGRWMRTGRGVAQTEINICDPCSCCPEVEELLRLRLYCSRMTCCNGAAGGVDVLSVAPGIYQSGTITCNDGFESEWTVDTNADPVTATLRTTNGDAVYSIANDDFYKFCGQQLTLVGSAPTGCQLAPCICIGPVSCGDQFPCDSTSTCQEHQLPEEVSITFADSGNPTPIGPNVWTLNSVNVNAKRAYRYDPAEVVYQSVSDIVFTTTNPVDTVTVSNAVFRYKYECATGQFSLELAFCGYCSGSVQYEGPETAYVPDSGPLLAPDCPRLWTSAPASFQKYTNCSIGTGNASCEGTGSGGAVELYDASNYFMPTVATVAVVS